MDEAKVREALAIAEDVDILMAINDLQLAYLQARGRLDDEIRNHAATRSRADENAAAMRRAWSSLRTLEASLKPPYVTAEEVVERLTIEAAEAEALRHQRQVSAVINAFTAWLTRGDGLRLTKGDEGPR